MHYSASPDSLNSYMRDIQKYPPLSFEDEQALANRFLKEDDEKAMHTLMQSYLRLVVKAAMGFRGYGLPVAELIQEGNIGLMTAIRKFDPDKGFRLSTYAMWWIRAQMQEYILANWSLVKISNSSQQKKLFFNLKRLQNELRELSADGGTMSAEQLSQIADKLDVEESAVTKMGLRINGGDRSLNMRIGDGDEGSTELMDLMADNGPNQEDVAIVNDEMSKRSASLNDALNVLDERERHIITVRRLAEEPQTLEQLSQFYGVSRERVRQLEERAIKKLKQEMTVH